MTAERHPEAEKTIERVEVACGADLFALSFLRDPLSRDRLVALCSIIDEVIAENARLKQRVEALERRPAGKTRLR